MTPHRANAPNGGAELRKHFRGLSESVEDKNQRNEKMNNELKINEKKTTNEWLTEHCSIANLEGHNRSLEWLLETANRMDATIDTRITDGYSSQGVCFAIQLQGNHSGVLYRIKVTFNPKVAKLLGKRGGSWAEDNFESMVYPFREMVQYESFWFDHRKGDWERVCVIRKGDGRGFWPFDTGVSLMEALRNDMDTALQMDMDTLRKSLIESYPVSWFNGNTDASLGWDEVKNYCSILWTLQSSGSEEMYEEHLDHFQEVLGELSKARLERISRIFSKSPLKAGGAE